MKTIEEKAREYAELEIGTGRKNPDNIIAIDPDVDRSGVAWLHPKTRQLECDALPFPELLDYLLAARRECEGRSESLVVVVEAGWMVRTHYHANYRDTYRAAAAKGNSVGRNHETGRNIVAMCRHYGLTVVEQRPLRKIWAGPDRKITHRELVAFAPIANRNRTSQEMRDAALLAWNAAGLPMSIL
ncbi:MAG: hypothetical protein K2G93_03910 [Rikenella sp.]|nr:hypothetical protein [Rikenella sp.]